MNTRIYGLYSSQQATYSATTTNMTYSSIHTQVITLFTSLEISFAWIHFNLNSFCFWFHELQRWSQINTYTCGYLFLYFGTNSSKHTPTEWQLRLNGRHTSLDIKFGKRAKLWIFHYNWCGFDLDKSNFSYIFFIENTNSDALCGVWHSH